MKKLYIILIAVFSINMASAQMTNYTTSNSGLLCNNISSVAIDSQGNKWFANFESGVSKFDGTNWTTYTTSNSGLISQFVHTMAIDAMDNKWIGTWDGLSKYNGTNWISYTTANGLCSNDILSVAIDAQGNKWIGTSGGVSKYNDTSWTNYTIFNSAIADSSINAIAIDNLGNKWLGTAKGVSKFDGVNWTNYLSGENINTIAIDTQNNVWVGTGLYYGGLEHGIFKFDGNSWTNFTTSNSGLINNAVFAISIDNQGNKWFGTNGGLSKFDGTNWITYNYSNSGLVNNYVKAIALDNQGDKWVGTNGGVSELSNCGIPPVENICFVEFDSATTKNSINWTNNLPVNVDSIKIYVEVSTNVWSLIGSVSSNQNHFIDINSNPFSQSYSYKITTIDTCGTESDYSSSHTTITLLAAYDQGSNAYGFTWSAYNGLPVPNYNLYGIMANGTETLIGSVPGNQYFFNYANPYAGFVHYFIGFNTPSCNSKTDYLVKSNWVQSPTGIYELTGFNNLIKTYPNPANEIITIESAITGNQDFIVSIKDIQGQELLNEKINFSLSHSINVSSLSNGIYFLTLQNEKENYLSKIVIQR